MQTGSALRTRRSLTRAARVLAAAFIALTAVSAAVPNASAATHAPADSAASPFAAQAAAAGLSRGQAAQLQAQVDAVLARDGGTQVAANEIALPHGSSVLLPLPGQTHAHVLPGAVNLGFAPAAASGVAIPASIPTSITNCPSEISEIGTIYMCPQDGQAVHINGMWCYYEYFCAWTGPNASGAQFNVSTCGVDQELPGSGWNGVGSWLNNQTPGLEGSTETKLKDANHNTLDVTTEPKSFDTNFNWRPIWYLDACGA